MEIKVLKDILSANDGLANKNQGRLKAQGILTINVMASPGAGKTSLLLQTIDRLKETVRLAVIEGDIASTIDADKISKQGVRAVQINTAGGCHLDANMIEQALNNLPLEDLDLLFIENVGNLVCPAEFSLGEDKKVMVFSLPEGDDKPYKYPLMFSQTDVILINKIDLLSHLDFDIDTFIKTVSGLNPKAKILQVSCKTGQGLEDWVAWLKNEIEGIK
ncbi:hydrogenase nickel incorporation protein HypB [Chloroflexota bacterium]